MVAKPSFIQRLFGKDQALDEEQTDQLAQIGQLKREIAAHPSYGLTPTKLYQIIGAAENGDLKAQSELFEDMEEKDPQIGAALAQRRQLAAELEWQIVPPENANRQERRATDFCVEVFAGIEVEDLIIDMGSGLGHGWANLELRWQRDGAMRFMDQPMLRPHSWFQLQPDDQNLITLRDASIDGEQLWPLGWIKHRHKAKPGYVARSGLHRLLVWPYLFQNYALGDLAELLEIYGIPARIGKYPNNASAKEKSTLLRAVTNLGHRAAGIIPEGMSIDFKEAADGKSDLYDTMINWCERSKAKVILGNTLTSGTGEGTNTNALGNVHERTQASLIHADARQYAGSICRDMLWPLVALNFGISQRRRAPQFLLDTGIAENYKQLADSLPVFVDMGARIPTWWLHEKTRIPEAHDDEPMLVSPQQPTPSPTMTTARVALKAETPASQNDEQGNRLDDDVAPHLDDWIDQIRELVMQAESLDAIRDGLLALYPKMTLDDYAKAMQQALSAASLNGRYDIMEEANGND